MTEREWKCGYCGDWVSIRYLVHVHAILPKLPGGPREEVHAYERKPDDPVRDRPELKIVKP